MTAHTQSAAAGRTFTGRHMLALMIGFFGVVIGVNVLLAVYASTTWSGLVVPNSYVASQEFQARHDAMEAQRALGWVRHFTYAPGAARFVIVDAAGRPVDLGPITLQVNRPVGTKDDVALTLQPVRRGTYEAALILGEGTWDATIGAETTAAGPFHYQHRFAVEAANP